MSPSSSAPQLSLFDKAARPAEELPPGLSFQPDVLTPAEEANALAHLAQLPLQPFQFHGWQGNRRTLSFGWGYDYGSERKVKAPDIPDFLLPLRARAAAFADLDPRGLEMAHVIHYPVGAGIGWHRDKAAFGQVVGLSLLSPCTIRLRKKTGEGKWQRYSFPTEPRAGYLFSGRARSEWEHSVAPLEVERYSVTFRTLAR